MSRLRIVHLITAASPVAGAEKMLLDIARAGHTVGWESFVCTLTARGRLHDELESSGIPARAFDVRSYGTALRALASMSLELSKIRPHVLHTHLFHASVIGAVVAQTRPRMGLVQTRHYANYVSRFRPRRLALDGWAARRADRIIAVSEAAKSHLVAKERVRPNVVDVIANGVDWRRLSAIRRSEARADLANLGVSLAGPVLGCTASFNVCKGQEFLVRALPDVLRRYPGAQLVFIGDGPERARIRNLVVESDLASHVHFLGYRTDAKTLMAGLDVYVQPSVEEGFGLALVEAMAMGRVVIAADVGGMSQIVEHGVSGLLVRPGNARDIADAVLSVLDSPAVAASLENHAAERVRMRYALDFIVEKYDRVYRTIPRRPRGS